MDNIGVRMTVKWTLPSFLFRNNKAMENELIRRVKEVADNEAFMAIEKECERMIYGIINTYDLSGGDYLVSREDMYQEALIALYKACEDYDENMGARFTSFAYLVIKRHLNKLFYQQKRMYFAEPYSYDRYENADHHPELANGLVAQKALSYGEERTKERLDEILKPFPLLDRQILIMRLEGYPYRTIAERLKISLKDVDNHLCRIKKRVKNIKR